MVPSVYCYCYYSIDATATINASPAPPPLCSISLATNDTLYLPRTTRTVLTRDPALTTNSDTAKTYHHTPSPSRFPSHTLTFPITHHPVCHHTSEPPEVAHSTGVHLGVQYTRGTRINIKSCATREDAIEISPRGAYRILPNCSKRVNIHAESAFNMCRREREARAWRMEGARGEKRLNERGRLTGSSNDGSWILGSFSLCSLSCAMFCAMI